MIIIPDWNMAFRKNIAQTTTVFLLCLIGLSRASSNSKKKLLEDLFANYSHDYIPVKNNEAIAINVSFELRNIHKLEERLQRFVTSGWFTVNWRDEFLTWDPAEYSNITSFSSTELWKPDLVLFNGYTDFVDLRNTRFMSVVYSSGDIMWAPAMTFDTHCRVDVTFYPFDKQTCCLEVISWTYSMMELNLLSPLKNVSLSTYVENGEWDITETSVGARPLSNLQCCHGDYIVLEFNITMTRRRDFFVMNMLIPTISESLLCNLVFLVPSESGERMSLAITVLLSYAVFLGVTIDALPRSSLNISVMSMYMLTVLLLGTVSVFLTGISLYLYHRHDDTAPPVVDSLISPKLAEVNAQGFGPENRLDAAMKSRQQSRRFDRVCLLIISGMTLVSLLVFIIVLISHTA